MPHKSLGITALTTYEHNFRNSRAIIPLNDQNILKRWGTIYMWLLKSLPGKGMICSPSFIKLTIIISEHTHFPTVKRKLIGHPKLNKKEPNYSHMCPSFHEKCSNILPPTLLIHFRTSGHTLLALKKFSYLVNWLPRSVRICKKNINTIKRMTACILIVLAL